MVPDTLLSDLALLNWHTRFNIYSFGFNTTEDEAGMLESAKSIGQLIAKEIDEGLDPGRVILGGFSQGATMSLLTGMSLDKKLAGLAVLSGWLPLKDKFKSVCRYLSCKSDNLSSYSWRLRTPLHFQSSGVLVASILL